ncbi:MAG: hypothetical protein U5L02_14095 [Rheinheimera sp.]|nr:hypothetical protein [Rheinheimera sp.]
MNSAVMKACQISKDELCNDHTTVFDPLEGFYQLMIICSARCAIQVLHPDHDARDCGLQIDSPGRGYGWKACLEKT